MPNDINPQLVESAEAMGLRARSIVEGLRVGDNLSPNRGFSVEFAQHREYISGDDTRHIDWKVYGRAERYLVKQHAQETNFVGHILLDASRSMVYGEGPANKLEYAKLLAATLSYTIVRQRDSVGLNVFDSAWRARLAPGSHPGQLHAILRILAETEPRGESAMGPLLHELADSSGRRGLVFLITDALDAASSILDGLRHLRFLGHEVVVFQVLHRDEIDFPFDATTRFEGMEDDRSVLTRPRLLRPAYLRALRAHLDEFREGCEASRCDYTLIDTSRPLREVLIEYLARRKNSGRLRP